jgi:hypothetical protein
MFETLESRVVMTAVAWYPLDETSGVVANDASGNARYGTVIGGTWASGQLSGAIDEGRGKQMGQGKTNGSNLIV